jgi:hypothetical protein
VVNANGHGPKLRPGILLLPEGPNGAKWGIDDFAANRDWGIDDFDSFIFPLPEVFDLETGRYEGEKCFSSSSRLMSENDENHLPIQTIAEFLEATPESYDWVVDGLLARGAITKLAGKAKFSGKTTLLAFMAACIVEGTSFLGRRTERAIVLYLTEQGSNFKVALG